jgi:hypothetical protein
MLQSAAFSPSATAALNASGHAFLVKVAARANVRRRLEEGTMKKPIVAIKARAATPELDKVVP